MTDHHKMETVIKPSKRFNMERVTLLDVARRAQVSTATVSRCINAPHTVRALMREKVQAAIEELGYVPHGAARALASRRWHTIGAIVPTSTHAIFGAYVNALEDFFYDEGYSLLLASSHYDLERELRQVEHLLTRGLDGLVLVGHRHHSRLHRIVTERGVPCVTTWAYSSAVDRACVGFDNQECAERVANYLIDIGHREIAMIAGMTQNNDRAAERVVGVRAALDARGFSLPPHRVVERPYEIGEGRRSIRALMSQRPAPTAVICGNDVLAFGAIFECRTLGIRVPQDVSITGFDDVELAAELSPPLTTVRVPAADIGRLAAENILAQIAGKLVPASTKLETNLIIRGTTAPPSDSSRS